MLLRSFQFVTQHNKYSFFFLQFTKSEDGPKKAQWQRQHVGRHGEGKHAQYPCSLTFSDDVLSPRHVIGHVTWRFDFCIFFALHSHMH